jgi:hypothetical protein
VKSIRGHLQVLPQSTNRKHPDRIPCPNIT